MDKKLVTQRKEVKRKIPDPKKSYQKFGEAAFPCRVRSEDPTSNPIFTHISVSGRLVTDEYDRTISKVER